jgi:hypothetical protein
MSDQVKELCNSVQSKINFIDKMFDICAQCTIIIYREDVSVLQKEEALEFYKKAISEIAKFCET